MQHIAREGEQEFAAIKRNRSGFDAGCIDYGLRVQMVENLAPAEKKELLKTAEALVSSIRNYCQGYSATELALAALDLARHAGKASLESLGGVPDLFYPDVDERGEHESNWEAWNRQLLAKMDKVRELAEFHLE